VPLPSKHFADDVGARLQWIAGQQGGEATLRISPEGLGPVEVRMTLDGDRVELGFSATQSETRQALQDALPKLREMLAQQGLQLGHADVGQKHAQSANDDAHHAANGERGADESESGAITLAPAAREASLVIGRSGRGVLDLYA
jgi:flagellar hook-length control protein FliK